MCVCVCVCVCVYVCVYLCVHMFVCAHMCAFLHTSTCAPKPNERLTLLKAQNKVIHAHARKHHLLMHVRNPLRELTCVGDGGGEEDVVYVVWEQND